MALTLYDAENGIDGLDCTTTTLGASAPESAANGNGGFRRFTSQAARVGMLGYHFKAVTGQNSYWRVNITASTVQAFRGIFRMVALPAATRRILQYRTDTGSLDSNRFMLQITSSGQLQITDTLFATVGTVATLSAGVDYDISLTATVGASTNDSQVTAKIYQKNSSVQVGSTFSSSTANFSNNAGGSALIESVYLGSPDTPAADFEYYWDFLRFGNDQGEFAAPIAASAALPASTSFTAGARPVPFVSQSLLGLEE